MQLTETQYHNKLRKGTKQNETIQEIGENSFKNCKNLTSITIPDSVTNIARFAFYNCENLHTAGLDVLETVPYCAFMFADLETLELPNAVRIANYAFYHNINLAAAIMPKVEYIGMFRNYF